MTQVLPCVPETKTYEPAGVDNFGREVGWVIPCEQDPYSEPYLAVVLDQQRADQ